MTSTGLEVTEVLSGALSMENVSQLNVLLTEFSSKAETLTLAKWDEMAANNYLVVAKSKKRIVGMATLVTFQIPTGKVGIIEDVIVSSTMRRRGLGEKLVSKLIDQAYKLELKQVDLTSRPSREVANHLYQKLGFKKRETNVYRLTL